jgi:hypothetical protein
MSCSFSFPACAYHRALLGARRLEAALGKALPGAVVRSPPGSGFSAPRKAPVHAARGRHLAPVAARRPSAPGRSIRARRGPRPRRGHRAPADTAGTRSGRRRGRRRGCAVGIVSSLLTVRQGLDFMTPRRRSRRRSGWAGCEWEAVSAGSCLSAGRGSPGHGEDGSRASRLSRGSRGGGGTGSAPAAGAVLGRVFRRFHALVGAGGNCSRAIGRLCGAMRLPAREREPSLAQKGRKKGRALPRWRTTASVRPGSARSRPGEQTQPDRSRPGPPGPFGRD